MTALLIAAYLGVTLACVYLEGRITGDPCFTALWLMWPALLPILAIMAVFEWLADLGVGHSQ